MILHRIFFSYSRVDGAEFALRLALDLKKEGFDVWIDQEDIRAGSEWDLEIEKALETCDCLLFVETEKSVASNNVLDEVYYAIGQNKKVIPVIVKDSKTPFRIQRLQHVDFTKDYNSGLTHLITELQNDSRVSPWESEEFESIKAEKPFYVKYSMYLLLISFAIITTALIYLFSTKNNQTQYVSNNTITNPNDTSAAEEKSPEQKAILEEKIPATIETTKKPVDDRIKVSGKASSKILTESNKIETSPENSMTSLSKAYAGDWNLTDVEPKAQSIKGYIKIEASDEKKVAIKSYMQFYYFKTNDTSFLTIFNAFAGCTSCTLQKEMKLTVEDVSIGSQTYRTGKTGDTVMNAGANKSIRASVSLRLISDKTVLIKVQRTDAVEQSYGLVLKPFTYTFKFTKVD
jgi:hypothetical protein